MRRFFGTLARIVFGLLLASLAAGLVTVLFVDIDVLSGPLDRLPTTLGGTIDLALLAATHIGIFSAFFVAIAAVIGEWFSIRALTFYLIVGVAIALLGFSVQYASEVAGQATILNNYAIKAFLAVGFVGGFVYWLAAGQFAGRRTEVAPAAEASAAAGMDDAPQPKTGESTSVVITHPPTVERQSSWRKPSLERLHFSKRTAEVRHDNDVPGDTDESSSGNK